jgi:hypothetical protein
MNKMTHKIDYRNGLPYDGIYIYRGFEIARGDVLGHEPNEYGDVSKHWFFGEIPSTYQDGDWVEMHDAMALLRDAKWMIDNFHNLKESK